MVELKIDKEFKEKIPPLTDAEFEQLRENILADGEVYEPIVTWNGVIVDGHNRWRIIQEHPEIPFKVKEMEFADKWAAFDWMYKKQLGRRNLTEAQREVLIGMMYKARKNSQGGDRRSEEFSSVQKANLNGRTPRTNEILGKELGINPSTVTRAEHFADGVEEIRKVSPKAAEKIMSGEAKVQKSVVRSVPQMTKEEVNEIAAAIEKGEVKKIKPRPMSPQMKDFSKKLLDVVSEMENTNKAYTLDDAIRDLNSAEDVFINQIEFVLDERKEVIGSDERGKEQVTAFIESVINDLNNLKGRFI